QEARGGLGRVPPEVHFGLGDEPGRGVLPEELRQPPQRRGGRRLLSVGLFDDAVEVHAVLPVLLAEREDARHLELVALGHEELDARAGVEAVRLGHPLLAAEAGAVLPAYGFPPEEAVAAVLEVAGEVRGRQTI